MCRFVSCSGLHAGGFGVWDGHAECWWRWFIIVGLCCLVGQAESHSVVLRWGCPCLGLQRVRACCAQQGRARIIEWYASTGNSSPPPFLAPLYTNTLCELGHQVTHLGVTTVDTQLCSTGAVLWAKKAMVRP